MSQDGKAPTVEQQAIQALAFFLKLSASQEIVLMGDNPGETSPICGHLLELKARDVFERVGWGKYHEAIRSLEEEGVRL